jgi:integrase
MTAEGFTGADKPVFCNTKGGHQRISNLHKNSFKPILKKAGLPDIRLYDLRHTCATLLLLDNRPVKVVSERLGHSSAATTMDRYMHVSPTMQKNATDSMTKFLNNGGTMGVQAPQPADQEYAQTVVN